MLPEAGAVCAGGLFGFGDGAGLAGVFVAPGVAGADEGFVDVSLPDPEGGEEASVAVGLGVFEADLLVLDQFEEIGAGGGAVGLFHLGGVDVGEADIDGGVDDDGVAVDDASVGGGRLTGFPKSAIRPPTFRSPM